MIFKKQGQIYQLTSVMQLPVGVEKAWKFLSNPANLKTITPNYMGFEIISDLQNDMFAGQLISYKVSPFLGIKMNWVSEISHVKKNKYFIDEQRIGPYTMWHHKHFLKEIQDGTEMTDIVHYKLPFSIITNRFHSILVKPKLTEIFEFRRKALNGIFGTYQSS